ncbi:MAG: fimbrillin family protein, partial [Bacteroides sp.]|nr:fimbrillin family protein [Bacteroides sp.]
ANETKISTLNGFYVYADAPEYNMFLNGVKATKKEGNQSVYILSENKYWPSDVEQFNFWAYGPDDLALEEGEPKINTVSQVFTNFTPKKLGNEQQDFVVAYTEAHRNNVPGMAVPLTFHHALSQIEIKANRPDVNKNVIIKGAWIVNVKSSGTLSFNKEEGEKNNYMHWQAGSTTTEYGLEFQTGATVVARTDRNNGTILIGNSNNNSGLMLVPQETEKLVFTKTGEGEATTVTDNGGAYILLLCRIEAIHDGTEHAGDDASETVKVDKKNNKHIHQLFPINKTASFKEEEYGYTCVPVAPNWKPGVKYIYNLEFCGQESGAGVYPPKIPAGLPEGENIIATIPDGKFPGSLVLDNPISFTVEVAEWTPADKDEPNTPMN